MELLSPLLTGLGLSGAAGLNAYIPLLLMGLLQRSGLLELGGPAALLGNSWVLLGVAIVGALDFVGDKVPGVDHVLHVAGGVVSAAAGAVLFASQTGLASGLDPALAAVAGLLVAGGVQAGRATLRPASTVLTGGVATPIVSAAEDGSSLLLSLLAVFAPLLGVLGLALLLWLGWRLWRRGRQALGREQRER